MSTMIISSDALTELDFEAQLEGADNGIYNKRENNKHKDSLPTQYNLLVALFPNQVINKKDLSNAIQRFKSQTKSNKND
ncbi:8356_t:CDS:2, partial [Cetraspora pellucida]